MEKISATRAQNNFGGLLDSARRMPIEITKEGRSIAVILAIEEFERLQTIEDKLLALQAKQANEEGYIGVEASEDLLNNLLNVET
ncbi:MAG: type II toxin-antitoxin system prevent-host-death family antitoxin [Cyanobacteriota bacterium ELA615]